MSQLPAPYGNRSDRPMQRQVHAGSGFFPPTLSKTVQSLVSACHEASTSRGWWNDIETGESLIDRPHIVGEKFALIHSEVSEAMEAFRKDLMDDKIPTRPGVEVELADAVIRICDLAGVLGLDLGGAVQEKMEFNRVRADHSPEERKKAGGKKF